MKEKVISAIKFELDRGGQVFYVLPWIKGNVKRTIYLFFLVVCIVQFDLHAVESFPGFVKFDNYIHCEYLAAILLTGLEDVMDFLEEVFSHVEIAIAHGKVNLLLVSPVSLCRKPEN